jgi:membrane-bound lytic murein transglycosylase MltF
MKADDMRTITLSLIRIVLLFAVMTATQAWAIGSDLKLVKKWSGDFDGMAERHLIRALVPPSKTFYFLDGADQRGLTYELLKEFETYLNNELQRKNLKIKVVVIPTKRDRLLPGLVEGFGDIAAGNLTITPERQKKVDFSATGAAKKG